MDISIDIEPMDIDDGDIVSIGMLLPEVISIPMLDILWDAVGIGVLGGS